MSKRIVSISEFRDNGNRKFKLTRRIPELSVSETKLFDKREDAVKLMNEWLNRDDPFP